MYKIPWIKSIKVFKRCKRILSIIKLITDRIYHPKEDINQ